MTEPTLHHVVCPGAAAPDSGFAQAATHHRMAYWEWNDTGNPQHPHVLICTHGLTRQGRDFDTLARALSPHMRVVCPDVAGRGHSDWLADPMGYQVPQYAADMLCLLAQLQQAAPITTLDWVGTSLGGLIGMALCGQPGLAVPDAPVNADAAPPTPTPLVGSHWPLAVPVRKLVLNDVGPVLQWDALQRIGQYVGQPVRFASLQQAADALWVISTSFGPHTPAQWLALSAPMVRPMPDGSLRLHYDPAIATAFKALTPEMAAANEVSLWQLFDHIRAHTLLLRGAQSDLLTGATVQAMSTRGPRPACIEFAGVGHAPTLVADDQVNAVRTFLLA